MNCCRNHLGVASYALFVYVWSFFHSLKCNAGNLTTCKWPLWRVPSECMECIYLWECLHLSWLGSTCRCVGWKIITWLIGCHLSAGLGWLYLTALCHLPQSLTLFRSVPSSPPLFLFPLTLRLGSFTGSLRCEWPYWGCKGLVAIQRILFCPQAFMY